MLVKMSVKMSVTISETRYVTISVKISANRFVNILKLCKGEQGTAELGANTVLKQTNELCF